MSAWRAISVMVVIAARVAHADVRLEEGDAEQLPAQAAWNVALVIDACLEDVRGEIARAVQLEVPSSTDARIVLTCPKAGAARGVIIEIQPAHGTRRYRYALDWQSQPVDARPRLLGLAVAEALAASRIELVAVIDERPAVVALRPASASRWLVGGLLGGRRFAGEAGVSSVGGGMSIMHRRGTWLLGAELFGDGATQTSGSGVITATSISIAPRIAYRLGARIYAEGGAGARLGIARMRGEATRSGLLDGSSYAHPWFGPLAMLAVGAALTESLAVSARVEVGAAVVGATARDFGEVAATFDGRWTSVLIGAELAL